MNAFPMVSLSCLGRGFAGAEGYLPVLDGIDLDVGTNEFVSVVGPSGCGKSTMLRIIAGLDTGYSGNVTIDGKGLVGGRVPVRYMLQKDLLMPWRNLIDNVLLPREIAGGDMDAEAGAILPLIREFGLEGFERYLPSQLSGGMRQRAALLRTYLMEGCLMLLDEPFGALDEITRMSLQDWLIGVWERHRVTVILVTHHIEEAILLSDRVLVMGKRPGTIIADVGSGLPRPRTREMLLTPEYLDCKRRITAALSGHSSSP